MTRYTHKISLYNFIKDGNTYNVIDADGDTLGFIIRSEKHYFEPINDCHIYGVNAMREIADFLYMLDNKKKFKSLKKDD